MTATHIVIQYRDKTIRCFTAEEYYALSKDEAKKNVFRNYRSIQTIDDAVSPEMAIWKAAQLDLSEDLETAAELLEKALDWKDWEADKKDAKRYESLDAVISKITDSDSVFCGMNKFYRDDYDEVCWSDEKSLGSPWKRCDEEG